MNENVLQNRGRVFAASAVGTLAVGVGAAALVIFHLRPPPPLVVQTPPETKVVQKVVYVPQARPDPSPPPPSAPLAAPPEPQPQPAAPPVAAIQATGVWDGVWRQKKHPLPMFRLNPSGDAVAGTCVPNWGTVVPFRGGAVTGDALEFVVDDQVFRVHVRMTMVGDDKAKVEQWVTDADWETSLERANKAARTPQQALLARAKLEVDAKKFRKPATLGIFTRQAGE